MRIKPLLLTAIGAAALLLSGCASGSSSSSSGTTYVPPVQESAKVTGGFDSPLSLPDGSSFTLSSPSIFTPGHFASGQLKGQKYEGFKISVVNNTKAALDLSTLIVSGQTEAGACADIFDGDQKVNGAPTEKVAIGATVEVDWALSCPGSAGSKFDVTLQNNGTNLIQATGKLA